MIKVYDVDGLNKKETKRVNKKKRYTLSEMIERRKRSERDARLVKMF